jgi:hypothetical protein
LLTAKLLSPNVRVVINEAKPTPSPETMARVDSIWDKEIARHEKTLFNGRLFSIASEEPSVISGWLAEYKWFVAQRRDPTLFSDLRVQALAVTGLLLCRDGIVFGRRASDLEQDTGLWELVPSGGVTGSTRSADRTVDFCADLLAELSEEIGLGSGALSTAPQPFAMVSDADAHVSDLGILLRSDLSAAAIIDSFSALKGREYVMLEVVPVVCLATFIEDRAPDLAAVSIALVNAARDRLECAVVAGHK